MKEPCAQQWGSNSHPEPSDRSKTKVHSRAGSSVFGLKQPKCGLWAPRLSPEHTWRPFAPDVAAAACRRYRLACRYGSSIGRTPGRQCEYRTGGKAHHGRRRDLTQSMADSTNGLVFVACGLESGPPTQARAGRREVVTLESFQALILSRPPAP